MAGVSIRLLVLYHSKSGWFFSKENKALKYDPDHEYAELHPDQRTMAMLRDLADTLDPNLTFTFDCPSLNANGRMPILDIQVWIHENKVRHTFFRKPCAPNRVIDSRSAVSTRTKRDTLFSEVMRILSAMDEEPLKRR